MFYLSLTGNNNNNINNNNLTRIEDSGKKNPYSVDGSINSCSHLTKLKIAGRYSSVVKYFLSLYKALDLIPSKRGVGIHKLKVQLSYEEEICQCTTEMLEMHNQLWPYS